MYVIDIQYGCKITGYLLLRILVLLKYSIYEGFFKEIARQKGRK
jgi:hypothetical protein